jgi:hypothetical protein
MQLTPTTGKLCYKTRRYLDVPGHSNACQSKRMLTYREKAIKGPPVALHNEINVPDIQYYSNSLPVGKGRLKERCGLKARTNFFRLRRWQKLGAD